MGMWSAGALRAINNAAVANPCLQRVALNRGYTGGAPRTELTPRELRVPILSVLVI